MPDQQQRSIITFEVESEEAQRALQLILEHLQAIREHSATSSAQLQQYMGTLTQYAGATWTTTQRMASTLQEIRQSVSGIGDVLDQLSQKRVSERWFMDVGTDVAAARQHLSSIVTDLEGIERLLRSVTRAGEGGQAFVRVEGVAEARRTLSQMHTTLREVQDALSGTGREITVVQQAAENGAARIVQLEERLAALRMEGEATTQSLTGLAEIQIAAPGVPEVSGAWRQDLEGVSITLGQLNELTAQQVRQFADLEIAVRKGEVALSENQAAALDYFQAVSQGTAIIETQADRLRYIQGYLVLQQAVYQQSAERSYELANTAQRYTDLLLRQGQIGRETTITEQQLVAAREAHQRALELEAESTSRVSSELSNAIQQMKEMIEAQRELQATAAAPTAAPGVSAAVPTVLDATQVQEVLAILQQVLDAIRDLTAALDRLEQRYSTIAPAIEKAEAAARGLGQTQVHVTATVNAEIEALERLVAQAETTRAALAQVAAGQQQVAAATTQATQAAQAQAGMPQPTFGGGRRIVPPAKVAVQTPEEPYIVPSMYLADYQELTQHLQSLDEALTHVGGSYDEAGRRQERYSVMVDATYETLGRLTITYDANGQAIQAHYNYVVRDAQGIEYNVTAVRNLIGAVNQLGDVMQRPPVPVPAEWSRLLQTAPMEVLHQRLRAVTQAYGPLNVQVKENGERVTQQALRWAETGQVVGNVTRVFDAHTQQERILREYTLATADAEQHRVRILTEIRDGEEQVIRGEQRRAGILNELTSRLQVHFHWMLRYIVLWKGLQLIQSLVRGWFEANMELHRSLGLMEASIGSNVILLREYEDALYATAAAAKALPTEMAPAAFMAARIYDPQQAEEMLRMAGELALVSGEQVEETTRLLILLQRQTGYSTEQMVGLLDALAGSLRHTTLQYSDLLPMLRRAGAYHERYNMSLEETVGLQAGMAAATGSTSAELDSLMRGLATLYELGSDANQMLTQMGIQTVLVGEKGQLIHRPLTEVLKDIYNLIGDDEARLQDFSETVFRTGSISRVQFETMIRGYANVDRSIDDARRSQGEWAKTADIMSKQWNAAMKDIASAWQELMTSMRLEEAFIEDLATLANLLRAIAEVIREADRAWDDLKGGLDLTDVFKGTPFQYGGMAQVARGLERPYSGLGLIARLHALTMRQRGLIPEREEAEAPPAPGAGRLVMPPITQAQLAARGLPSALSIRTTTVEIPEGVTFQDLINSYENAVDRWIGTFRDEQGNLYRITRQQIESAQQQVLVWDEATQQFHLMNAFLPALNQAIQENTEAIRAMTPALRFVEFDPRRFYDPFQRMVRHYEAIARTLGFREEPRLQVLWGPEDQYREMIATDVALQLALHALQGAVEENTEALTEGMWNIPAGVTAWVPITSLFYQDLQRRGGRGEPNWEAVFAQLMEHMGEGITPEMTQRAFLPAVGRGARVPGAGQDGRMQAWIERITMAPVPMEPAEREAFIARLQAMGATPEQMEGARELVGAASDLDRAAGVLSTAGHDLESAATDLFGVVQATISYMEADVAVGVVNVTPPYLPPILKSFQEGGIATHPTVGLFGERQPEAVIPLSRLPDMLPHAALGGVPIVVKTTLVLDGKVLSRHTQTTLAEVL